MYISKLSLNNYRNFSNAKLLFQKGVNTIIGENGSGKTNVFRAIRLLLDDNFIRQSFRLDEDDFHRVLGNWRGHWIIISLEFQELSSNEAIQALFLHGAGVVVNQQVETATYNLIFRPNTAIRLKLSKLPEMDDAALEAVRADIHISDYETIFTGRSTCDFNDPQIYKELVGDFDNVLFPAPDDNPIIGAKLPKILSLSREICFTFVQALRDVVGEFHNNRTNPLLTLLKSKSGEIDPAVLKPITEKVKELNKTIADLDDVKTLRGDITTTIKATAGETYSPKSLSIKSELPDEAEKLFQQLRLFVGESEDDHEGPIHDLSLGGANLIYLTLKLLQFKYQQDTESFANFLLIEEPEAHLHTHIQKTLFDNLNYDQTQIIYSTHSTHISEVSNVLNINVLGKIGGACEAYQPSHGLDPEEVGNIQRFLDAVRCNLLFAKSVILVEGDAEEILIPILIKQVLGISLDELGISLINVRSTGFSNLAVLFHKNRLHRNCSIVTDLDQSIIDLTPVPGDTRLDALKEHCRKAQDSGARRKIELDALIDKNDYLDAFYAQTTFEVEFLKAGNLDEVISLVPEIYVDSAKRIEAVRELCSSDVAISGRRILRMAVNEGKGWFAILLGKKVTWESIIPNYILKAIFFANASPSREIWGHIFAYRLKCWKSKSAEFPEAKVTLCATALRRFRESELSLGQLKDVLAAQFPNDDIMFIIEAAT